MPVPSLLYSVEVSLLRIRLVNFPCFASLEKKALIWKVDRRNARNISARSLYGSSKSFLLALELLEKMPIIRSWIIFWLRCNFNTEKCYFVVLVYSQRKCSFMRFFSLVAPFYFQFKFSNLSFARERISPEIFVVFISHDSIFLGAIKVLKQLLIS